MRFGPNAEQVLLQRSAREFFDRELPGERLRRLLEEGHFGRELWQDAARLGWLGALIPEEHGGSGLALADMVVVLEEAGRALAPLPFLETGVIAALAFRDLAVPSRAGAWLRSLALGELVVAAALHEDADILEPARISVTARRADDGWTLEGVKPIVAFGADADIVLTLAGTAEGLTLFAVPRTARGVTVRPVALADLTARAARIDLQGVFVGADHVLGAPGRAALDLAPVLRAARVGLSAEMLGGAARVVELSVTYAKQRVQFDKPIGSFQAIKHKLADMQLALEGIRGLVYAASAAADLGATQDPIVEVTKAACNDAYRMITSEGIQVHGGIGFTWEHDLHFFYKRALRARSVLGTSQQLYHDVGLALLAGRGFSSYQDS